MNTADHTHFHAQLDAALKALVSGRREAAEAIASQLSQRAPKHPDVLYLQGELKCAVEDYDAALDLFTAAAQVSPSSWSLHLRRAELLLFLRRRLDAHAAASAAQKTCGTDPQALWMCAKALAKCNDFGAAAELLVQAARGSPHDPGIWYDLAANQFFLGNTEAAESAVAEVLACRRQDQSLIGHALYLRATLRRQDGGNHHLEDLRKRLSNGLQAHDGRAACWYALAKELEDLGDHQAAHDALREGTKLRCGLLRPDVSSEVDTMSKIAMRWTREAVADIENAGRGSGAIFIVGLPRTGTTLTESILLRDSRVVSAGELLDFPQLVNTYVKRLMRYGLATDPLEASLQFDFPAMGVEYLRSAREAAQMSERFVDKLPVNFLYLGLIAKCLPGAKIIHLQRHPLDAAYAIHKTLFPGAYLWSCDLNQVADYIVAYWQLMRHWHAVLPGRILDVSYESLVTRAELEAKRLLDWCGLDAKQAVPSSSTRRDGMAVATASAAQVREPIHARSVGGWKRHGHALQQLLERFQAAGLPV